MGAQDPDFRRIDQLLDSLLALICEAAWPESQQGEFLYYVTRNVYEFGCAIRTESAAGRWTAAASLIRPLQERSEYAFAAAIDPRFCDRYMKYMDTQIAKYFTAKHRKLVETARGTIDRWANESEAKVGCLDISISCNRIGSEISHHCIGLTGGQEIAERLFRHFRDAKWAYTVCGGKRSYSDSSHWTKRYESLGSGTQRCFLRPRLALYMSPIYFVFMNGADDSMPLHDTVLHRRPRSRA